LTQPDIDRQAIGPGDMFRACRPLFLDTRLLVASFDYDNLIDTASRQEILQIIGFLSTATFVTPSQVVMAIQCFTHVNSNILLTDSYFPCGNLNTTSPVLTCCGGVDTCMTDGLCFHQYSAVGESGYYASGCTSSDFTNPACFPRCREYSTKIAKIYRV